MSPGCAKNRTNPFRWPTLIRPSDIATLIFTQEDPSRVKPMNFRLGYHRGCRLDSLLPAERIE